MYIGEDGETRLKTNTRIKPYVQFVIDIIVLGLVVGIFVVVFLFNTPVERGFFCDDNSLKYPDKEEQVPYIYLLLAVIGITLVTVAILELAHKIRAVGFYGSLVGLLKYFGFSMIGLFSMMIIQDIASKIIGGLRPNFWKICQPIYDQSLCTAGKYITEYTCAGNTSSDPVEEARVTTPSGHAAIAFYMALWLCVYVQFRLRNPFSKFLKMSAQCALISTAYWVSLTRVTDFHSRMEDMLAGIVMGVAAAIWIILASNEHLDYNTKIFVVEETLPKMTLPPRIMHYNREVQTTGTPGSNVQRMTVGDTAN